MAGADALPEILQVRSTKFTYPSGSRPLDGFTLKRGIGVGGFGEVYFALSDAGKEVALKRIQRNLDIELRGVRQCLNLKHNNLIALWDIKTTESGECWVIMEYVPGPSLRDAIGQHVGGLPRAEIDRWFSASGAGVAYLHQRGIVHRDLKPGNIFEDTDQQVIKIGDYGLSKLITSSQRDRHTESVGTFHYMAPEIGKGTYGKEVDIYALGIILHELVTGRVPFDGESSQEIIMKHLTADPDLAAVPHDFRPVIRRALAKDPARRYASVEEMFGDLHFEYLPLSFRKRVETVQTQHRRVPPVSSHNNSDQTEQQPDLLYIGDEIRFGNIHDHDIVLAESVETTSDKRIAPIHRAGIANDRRDRQDRGPAAANTPPHFTGTGQVTEQVEVIDDHQSPAADFLADEPIAQAVKGGWAGFLAWWNNTEVSTFLKIVVAMGIVFLLMSSGRHLLTIVLGLGLIYLIYYLIRLVVLQPEPAQPSPPTKHATQASPQRFLSKRERQRLLRESLGKRSIGKRLGELGGSMALAAFVSTILCLLGLAVSGGLTETTSQTWRFFSWLLGTSLLASWSVLIINKTWEHRIGDRWIRRFVMLSLGLFIGLMSFGLAEASQVLWESTPVVKLEPTISPFNPDAFIGINGPTLISHIGFFVTLFLVLRWWRQADQLRRTRFNILGIGVCLIWAVVLGQVFYFPQPWAMILAVVISAAIQLASPWHRNQT